MHIVLIHQAFAALDEAGGTRHFELAQHLVRRNHRITIITSPVSYLTGKTRRAKVAWKETDTSHPGITILRTYTYPALHRNFVHRVFSFISFMISSFMVGMSLKQVDLVWGTTPPIFQCISAWLLARLKRSPLLLEVRDLWPAFAIAVGVLKNPLLISASLWLEKFLYRHADQVIVNSPGYVEHVRQRGARNVKIVANGVDSGMFDPQSKGNDFRRQHNLNGRFIVLYAGAHGMSNDLNVVLKAADLLRSEEKISFILIGDGKDKPLLQQQAREMNLPNLLFLPPVAKSDIREVFAASDACIAILMPLELYKTTYPNKVFDYMAAGRPVILAIDGVIRQLVEQAQAGIAVPPGDPQALANAVRQLADNPALSRRMGQRGRHTSEKYFDRSLIAEELATILAETRSKYE